jgi:hypothetical protein
VTKATPTHRNSLTCKIHQHNFQKQQKKFRDDKVNFFHLFAFEAIQLSKGIQTNFPLYRSGLTCKLTVPLSLWLQLSFAGCYSQSAVTFGSIPDKHPSPTTFFPSPSSFPSVAYFSYLQHFGVKVFSFALHHSRLLSLPHWGQGISAFS